MCLTLALTSAFYYDNIQMSLVLFIFFDMQSCLTGIEKVKKIREKSEPCACDVLVRYVLGVSKKKSCFV